MTRSSAATAPVFAQPIRQVVLMLIVLFLVIAGAWVAMPMLRGIFASNPMLNGFIGAVFLLGVVACFWQVWQLVQSVSWIVAFVQDRPGSETEAAPRILAPLAALLGPRTARMQISSSSSRSILDSVATRIDEARDITRYLGNLLIFLGLLGTFYGLATTVPAIVETIRSLAPQQGESSLDVFEKLMGGLESQLGGMGTAFSSSLLGLAGSLVVGLLDLFAGHGQNRFYRELEEWLSSITRIGLTGGEGESGDMAALAQVLDNLGGQIESLQTLFTQSDISRSLTDEQIGDLAAAISRLAARMEAEAGQTAVLLRIAEGQDRLAAALTQEDAGPHVDAESRMRLRSIDVQLLRILEEISAGRQESIADLRADLGSLTQAVRQLLRARG
ncbi:biopolymer transporter ExbB [Gemmobacter fulvus]|uniref:Biopolymer transporter ExbB n=1 Tax=Gemmobacter fulvus TaxID=2840474 RepID=A0A975P5X0_9RHOB|nr:biopolymer transporter ExbB [Gemmobacter fulvus]MBT9247522.1 biopolymer transporter ExbB [Gemmobacter fulvus]QWK89967.1 biopolymer transporter ExbB [Gemmobacter fulvus]